MSLTQSLAAQSLGIRPMALLRAMDRNKPAGVALYTDTQRRRDMRTLLDGAALSRSTVTLAFVKVGGGLRYIVCEPCRGVDATERYYTVKDLELTEQGGRDYFRRVCLDTVVAATVEYRAQ
jgi:hypothetical protein